MRARLRYWQAVLQCWSYVVRPYDMLADRRRWFWQRSTPCVRAAFARGVTTRDECEHGRYRDTCGWCM